VSDGIDPPSATPPARSRRRRGPLLLGVAVVVALIVGVVGGIVAGRATAPGPAIVVAPGPVVEQSPVASSFPVARPQASASARPDLHASGPETSAPPAVFTPSSDLGDEAAVASGYALTRGSVDPPGLAASLASTFGLAGDVSETGTGWVVGQPGGAVPTVTVNDDPLLTWTYADPVAAAEAEDGVSMKSDTAKELASEVLAGIGVDVTTVDWQIDRYANLTEVTAWQLVKGARTQLAWRIGFGKGGAIVSASGFAAGLIEVPGYPVVGAATAVRRAALPTWATLGPTAVPLATTDATATPTPQATSIPRRPALHVPLQSVVVNGAELGLAQFWQPDGSLLILPAYQLTGDDGSRWSLIAITSADVDFVKVPGVG
jgi:hypothetical protein